MPLDLSIKRQKHARWLYTRFNKLYWAGRLPKVPIEVGAGKLGCGTWGETIFEDEKVVLIRLAEANWTLDSKHSFLKATILHESLHVALGPRVEHDSPEWKAEALRISKLGALIQTL